MSVGRIYGRSIAFPPRVGENGSVTWSEGAENVRESIQIILLTEPGERIMLPEFGAGLRTFLFEPNTVATRRLIEERITQALERWEPRIKLLSVSVEADAADPQAAVATIHYELLANRTEERVSLTLNLTGAEGGA